MTNIIIVGNTPKCDIADAILSDKNINIVAGIVDYHEDQEFIDIQKSFLEKNNIKEITFEQVKEIDAKVGIVLTYSKIIPLEYFSSMKLLNIHAGILPKWRGFNSNAWAMVNGETRVGYTLHEATDEFDGGDIYHIFEEDVGPDEKYGDVVVRIREQVYKKLPKLLIDIANNEVKPKSQKGAQFCCSAKFMKEDGYITNWDRKTSYIYNIYRVMSHPYGTGIYFDFKKSRYEVLEMKLSKDTPDYIGAAGGIVNVKSDELWVKTQDNILIITKLLKDDVEINNFTKYFKIGQRL